MIKFQFDVKKIVQIVNYLLKLNKDKINYTKLMKMLYISDKELLKQNDFTITGDQYYSLDNGPILSNVYDLIGDKHSDKNMQLYWDTFFCKEGYDVKLVHDNQLPGDKISKAEKDVLDKIDKQFKKKSFGDLIDYTHDEKLFPEVKWKEAGESSIELSIEDILKSIGRTEEEIKMIEEETNNQIEENNFLQECCS